MIKQNINITLPEGRFNVDVDLFDSDDKKHLSKIYTDWIELSLNLKKIGGRSINLPEGLSESAFCLEMEMCRVNSSIIGANSSFDAFDIKQNKRIQIKSCSVLPDLTSFGQKSVWDDLYFCDFYRYGKWNGTFDIYHIKNEYIYNYHVNRKQTVKDQQKQNRRPRFSIFDGIIKPKNIKPIKTGNLYNLDVIDANPHKLKIARLF